jgi:HAE1 family hydrophobic/amphiphilic exporter-1
VAAGVLILAVLGVVFVMGLSLPTWVRGLGSLALFVVGFGIAVSPAIPTWGQLGGAFFPISDNSELSVAIEAPPGSNIEYTHLKAEEIGRIVRTHKEVAYTYTTVGTATGSGEVDVGNIYVRMTPKNARDLSQDGLSTLLRSEINRVGGVTAYTFEGGFAGNMKQIQVEVRGTDNETLARTAAAMEAEVRKVKGAADVGLSTKGLKPELDVQLNRGLAGTLGLTVGQLAMSLRPAFAGVEAGDWVDPNGETRDVTVRLAPEARQRAADLEQLPIVLNNGGGAGGPTTVPLGQVATIRQSTGPAKIDHLNQDKVIVVGANAQGRALSQVSEDINKAIASVPLPPGVRLSQGGQVKDQNEVFGSIFAALGLAVMLMYIILVVQFGSFLDPLAIMLSLPLSLIGVVLGLKITGDTLNLMSLIGVILLMGIVAKNAILLVDFAKWQRESNNMPLREALIEAGRVRLRPIIMTTLALIAGMIPVALGRGEGADFRAPLGRAVIGGVITSTLLTLLVIPTFYEILDEWRERLSHVFGGKRAEGHAHGEHVKGHGGGTPAPAPGAPVK